MGKFDDGQERLPTKDLRKALGESGTEIFGGILDEEYNTNLIGIRGTEEYDKMRRQDAKVRASMRIITLPLLAASWDWESPSEDKEDLENTEFLRHNLFERIKFRKFLKGALTMLPFGYSLFEKVFTIEDGEVFWKALEPRLQKTLWKWEQEDGKPGITQQLLSAGESPNKSTTLSIPANKLIHFAIDREGDNYEGISLLRSAYKHWFIKDRIYMLQAIAVERALVGVPVVSIDGVKAGTPEMALGEEMVENMRSNESSGVVKDKSWDLDILTSKGSGEKDIAKSAIDHHDRQIMVNVLAPFFDLGQTGQGSFALSQTQAVFFVMQLKEEAENIGEEMNDAGKELLQMNGKFPEKYPKLKATKIEDIDMKALSDALKSLTDIGAVDVDTSLKRRVRDQMDLPEIDYDDEAAIEQAERDAELKFRKENIGKKPVEPAKIEDPKEERKEVDKAVKKIKKENPEMSETMIYALFFEDDKTWDLTMKDYLNNDINATRQSA